MAVIHAHRRQPSTLAPHAGVCRLTRLSSTFSTRVVPPAPHRQLVDNLCMLMADTKIAATHADHQKSQSPAKQLGEVVKIRAKVNRAFTTSMEIGVSVIGENPLTGETRFCCNGYFTFVAKKTGDSKVRVPAIVPLTADEIREFKHADERRAFRTRQHQQQHQQQQQQAGGAAPEGLLVSPRPEPLPAAVLLQAGEVEERHVSPSSSEGAIAGGGGGNEGLRQSGPLHSVPRRLAGGGGMSRSHSSMHLHAAEREPDVAPLPTAGKGPDESAVEATQLVLPSHANTTGITFGGQIMAWMETCASISATKHARHFCIVVSADELHFLQPTYVGEAVTIRSVVTRLFNTSLEVAVSVDAENLLTGEQRHCNTAFFTFVAVDERGVYAPHAHIPPLVPSTPEEVARYHAAARRRHVRLQHKHATAPLVDSILK